MTVCPIAIAVGCKKCPAFSFCPLKGTLGDHKPDEAPPTDAQGRQLSQEEALTAGGRSHRRLGRQWLSLGTNAPRLPRRKSRSAPSSACSTWSV